MSIPLIDFDPIKEIKKYFKDLFKKMEKSYIGALYSLIPLVGEFIARGKYLHYTLNEPWLFATSIFCPFINFFVHLFNWNKNFPEDGESKASPFDDMLLVVVAFPIILRILFSLLCDSDAVRMTILLVLFIVLIVAFARIYRKMEDCSDDSARDMLHALYEASVIVFIAPFMGTALYSINLILDKIIRAINFIPPIPVFIPIKICGAILAMVNFFALYPAIIFLTICRIIPGLNSGIWLGILHVLANMNAGDDLDKYCTEKKDLMDREPWLLMLGAFIAYVAFTYLPIPGSGRPFIRETYFLIILITSLLVYFSSKSEDKKTKKWTIFSECLVAIIITLYFRYKLRIPFNYDIKTILKELKKEAQDSMKEIASSVKGKGKSINNKDSRSVSVTF